MAQLDPSKLRFVGYGPSIDAGGGDTGARSTIYETPEGQQIFQEANGRYWGTYNDGTGGKMVSFDPQGNVVGNISTGGGSFWDNTFGRYGLGDIGTTIANDPKFLAFLGTAAGGALASSCAGGAGAAASGGSGTAGMSAAELASMDAAGGGMAGTGLASGGVGTAGMSAAELAAMDAAGGADAGTGPTTTEGSWLSKLLGGSGSSSGSGIKWGGLLGGLINSGAQSYINNQYQQDMNKAVEQANQTLLGAGREAASMTNFTPYNVSGGLSGVKTNPDGSVSTTMDPRLAGVQDQLLGLSKGFLGGVNAGTPDQMAQQAYGNYQKWAVPQQQQLFSGLQDKLARQGLLGLNVNTGSVQGNGGNTSINPYYKDFAEGVASADLKNYQNSVLFGQQVAGNQMQLGTGALTGATGIDTFTRGLLDHSAKFGALDQSGRQAGANYIYNSAAEAAANMSQRRRDEAGADATRDKALWDSLWKNVF